ncbi:MAG: histidine phosphatase family protein [Bacillota bacterium]|nr:histidine phosphatase family protein [Bacillota bacterium]HHU30037.1 histidine phosphatase family protein [Bacillota bacterium]
MRIVLARHGETTANAERRFQGILDCPLNEVGRRQAEELACVIARYKPGKIFTSDLIRSIETAKPAARLLQISPVADPVFREYSWGILEGLTLQEAQDRYPEIFHVSFADLRRLEIPLQEQLADFRTRVKKGLSLLLSHDNYETVALIGHGRYLNALVVEFLGLDFNGPWPFVFASAAVCVLEAKGGRRRLLSFNEHYSRQGE